MAYGAIDHSFWTNGVAERLLSDREKLAFLYLLSSPHSNVIGFYRLPIAYMAHDLQWSNERVEKSLKELCREETGPLAMYDKAAEIVLIPSYLERNPLWKGNRERSGVISLESLPQTPLHFEFKKILVEHGARLSKLAAVAESVTSSESMGGLFAYSLDTAIDKDKDKDKDKPRARELEAEFDETFWPAVPNKLAKGKARAAFVKARAQASLETIMAGVPGYVAYEAGRAKQSDYRPLHPATWLNQERWGDEVTKKSARGEHARPVWLVDDDPKYADARRRYKAIWEEAESPDEAERQVAALIEEYGT